ncbi:MAG: 3-hydroxyacyl-CoA dehydrogenase NAD-binding domain-containing protein [Gammaproteobacteria bacterium]|nr:3-hydroxyacyl-CoA dehydrogenase NAD-binding domain-containing protein [Gammaproteobacteria bacterium]
MMQTYKNWRLETDNDQILWLYFDKQGASVNTINREVMEELSTIIDHVGNNPQYSGIILASAKKSGFIAGADISQFGNFHDINDAVALLKRGQHIIDRLENLKIPSVAMIDGFCLGGGLEIALGCHYRVAEESAKTRIGLPEVKLGIHPGWGGSVRMPKLIGPMQGLELVLSGRTVIGKVAAKLGFVDVAVPRRHLVRAAKYYVMNKPPRHQATTMQNLMNKQPARAVLASLLRKKLREKINPEHYPAPFLVIDNWERVGVSHDAAMEREAKSCGRLFFSDTSQNLVRVFYLQERLKNQAKDVQFKAQHVHVIGAGTMGGDIAAWCALQGMKVTLQDRAPEYIAPAIKRAAQLYREKLKEPYLIQKAMDRLIPDVNGNGVKHADVIIEAIYENLTAKQDLFRMLEKTAKPDAILATNTSSIPLDDINSVLNAPERLVGIHFFNPVSKMQLVEIVKSDRTKLAIADKATSFVRSIDRLPLPVKSSPGFLVNRILMPYLLEAVAMLDEGIPATAIDKAMTDFGMPMGPIALADTVGLDVCLSVAGYLGKYFNTPIPPKLKELVELGKLGRKSDAGFYQYKKGKRVKTAEPSYNEKSSTEISDRLVLRMLDEAFACLREGVVADSDLLDAGMIMGTGFAPFRGGPIHYAKSKGISELFQQFVSQQEKRGGKPEALHNWETQNAV